VRFLSVESKHFVRAPGRGLFEPATTLGDAVRAGDIAGRLHYLERPERVPEIVRFAADGILLCRRAPAPAELGDVLAHLGQPVEPAELL
jgi:predicted deacylase